VACNWAAAFCLFRWYSMTKQTQKTRVALLSVASNTTLVVLKLIVGLFIGSVAVVAEAVHSGVDLVAALIAYYAVQESGKPADGDHPFGHGKVENVSGVIEALLIFVAAGWIVYEAVQKLVSVHIVEAVGWGVGVMALSVAMNTVVSSLLFKVGKATDSVALQADAWHLRTDVWTSAGVMLGLGLMWVGERAFPGVHFHWLDPVAAIVVAVLIVRAAYKLTLASGRDLLDVVLPSDEEQWIQAYLAGLEPPVHGYHGLRTRKAGSDRFVELHLLVTPEMTVVDSHAITEFVTRDIQERLPECHVTVHIEPWEEPQAGRSTNTGRPGQQ